MDSTVSMATNDDVDSLRRQLAAKDHALREQQEIVAAILASQQAGGALGVAAPADRAVQFIPSTASPVLAAANSSAVNEWGNRSKIKGGPGGNGQDAVIPSAAPADGRSPNGVSSLGSPAVAVPIASVVTPGAAQQSSAIPSRYGPSFTPVQPINDGMTDEELARALQAQEMAQAEAGARHARAAAAATARPAGSADQLQSAADSWGAGQRLGTNKDAATGAARTAVPPLPVNSNGTGTGAGGRGGAGGVGRSAGTHNASGSGGWGWAPSGWGSAQSAADAALAARLQQEEAMVAAEEMRRNERDNGGGDSGRGIEDPVWGRYEPPPGECPCDDDDALHVWCNEARK